MLTGVLSGFPHQAGLDRGLLGLNTLSLGSAGILWLGLATPSLGSTEILWLDRGLVGLTTLNRGSAEILWHERGPVGLASILVEPLLGVARPTETL